ncbi:MAG: hypothetical protein KAV80_00780 [Methanomicrobia archaeon]|nr:hypothetical protein [Methanomicrobia archaeon]
MTKYNLEEMLAKLRNGELCTKDLPAEEVTYIDITSEDEIENLRRQISHRGINNNDPKGGVFQTEKEFL